MERRAWRHAARRAAAPVVLVTACVTGCQQYGAHPECPARGAPAWSEITSPHFSVVSDLPVEESEAIARELETGVAAIQQIAFDHARLVLEPTTVVVFEDESDMQYFLPGRVAGGFARALPSDIQPSRFMIFSGSLSQRVRSVCMHELTHDLFDRNFGWSPPWLGEGWAEYYSTVRVDGRYIVAGEAMPHLTFTGESVYFRGRADDGGDVLAVPIERVAPPSELLKLSHKAFYAALHAPPEDEEADDRGFELYLGAWAFVHLLLDGPSPYPATFASFQQKAVAGERLDQAWKAAFAALPPAQLDRDFARYLAKRQVVVQRKLFQAPERAPLGHRALNDAEVHVLWARLSTSSKANDVATLADFDEGVRLAPAWPDARYFRGIFHLRSARMKEAADDLSAAVRLAPRDPRFRLGIVALRQHEWEKAGSTKVTPEVLQASAELEVIAESAYELAVVAQQKGATGDLRGALAFAERAVSRAPIDPWVLDRYASVLAASGRLQQAVATQERAISFLPDDETNPEMFERLVVYRSQAQSGAVQ